MTFSKTHNINVIASPVEFVSEYNCNGSRIVLVSAMVVQFPQAILSIVMVLLMPSTTMIRSCLLLH